MSWFSTLDEYLAACWDLWVSTDTSKAKRKDTIRAALLQALIEGPGYGLELTRRVKKRTDGRMEIGQGRLYPALWDLQEEGLVTCYETDPLPERGGRPRKYYELTAEGLRSAQQEKDGGTDEG